MVRVLDLFREWDENGDGTVSKQEFQRAMPMLGLQVPREEVALLFDSWDPDGSGMLELTELSRILKRAGGGPAEVAFSKPPLDNLKLAANATPAQLRSHLANLKEECEAVRPHPPPPRPPDRRIHARRATLLDPCLSGPAPPLPSSRRSRPSARLRA